MLPCEADKGTSEQFKTFWATLHDQNETSVAELAPEVDEIENVELGKGSETFWPTFDPARRYDFCRRSGDAAGVYQDKRWMDRGCNGPLPEGLSTKESRNLR